MILTNFKNFKELSFTKCKFPVSITSWGLEPNKKLILNNELDFKGLTFTPKEYNRNIELTNLDGIDLQSNPFRKINFNQNDADKYFDKCLWYISKSKFQFISIIIN